MSYTLELPDIGEGVVEAEVLKWLVEEGERVAEDQPLVEVMTDKATVVIPSPRRGRVVRRCAAVGQLARVHAALVELELEAGEGPAAPPPTADRARAPAGAGAPAPPRPGRALAAPAVRALARAMGIEIDRVPGTGAGGRVTREDLAGASAAAHRTGAPAPPSPAPPSSAAPADERIPLRGLRRAMAEHMARSKRTAAHFTYVDECDVTELLRLKERMAAAAGGEGVRLTFLPFVVKAVVAALRAHPHLAAELDEAAGELIVRARRDVGIAAATGDGLIVPVVRGADRRSLLDLAREIERLAADARAGRSRPEDLGRSTFTITSLGALGGLFATPVLNHPEVAILGIHRARPAAVVRDGQVVIREVMNLSVTCDHRVVDGHEAAAFCAEVIRTLEDPGLLLLGMA